MAQGGWGTGWLGDWLSELLAGHLAGWLCSCLPMWLAGSVAALGAWLAGAGLPLLIDLVRR